MSSATHAKDETLMVEWNRQAPENLRSMEFYEALLENTPGSALSKLENFAKHVRRQCLSKFLARADIFRRIVGVHGSILDLGVNAGQSLFTWAQMSAIFEPLNYTRMVIGFDSFRGIPAVGNEDRTGPAPSQHLRPGGFAYTDIDAMRQAIRAYDSNRFLGHLPRVELVEGDIVETLPQYLANHQHLVVALLHLDMDVYEPTRVALEHVVPRMPKGAIIVFDELNQVPYPGETRAVHDVLGLSKLRIERFAWETGLSYAVLE